MSVEKLAKQLIEASQTVSTVESCTGGGIASACTDLAGSSRWFLGGLVTYSNEMKMRLGVAAETLQREGAVSEAVVRQMAEHGRVYCASDWCVSVSGVAGPDGGTPEKPVGTVWFAWAGPEQIFSERCLFDGARDAVREQAVRHAIQVLIRLTG